MKCAIASGENWISEKSSECLTASENDNFRVKGQVLRLFKRVDEE